MPIIGGDFGNIGNRFDEKEIKDIDKFIKYMIENKLVSSDYENKLSKFVTVFRDM